MFRRVSVAMHVALLAVFLRVGWLTTVLLAVYVVYHAILAWGVLHPRSRLFGPNRSRLPTEDRIVALTFDDGPHPEVTPKVLDLLRGRGIRATFFLIGKHVERHPEIVRRIAADGHTLGCHSIEHSYLFWALPPRRLLREVLGSKEAIEVAAGRPCRWFRAPAGIKSCLLHPILFRSGLELVSWSIRLSGNPRTGRDTSDRRRLAKVAPGSILLLHDGHDRDPEGNPGVVEALPWILSALGGMGYRCVPLEGPEPDALSRCSGAGT